MNQEVEPIPASRGRLVLALCLDYVMISAAYGLLIFGASKLFPSLGSVPASTKFVVFAVVEAILLKGLAWSPGYLLLGISYMHRSNPGVVDVSSQDRTAVVDPRIKNGESWFTLLAGTLLLLEGAKGLVRWTMWSPAIPLFGIQVPDSFWPALAILIGALECAVAVGIFRLKKSAIYGGLVFFIVLLASTLLSWELWPAWAEQAVLQRRTFQGIEPRPQEVDFMRKIAPTLALGGVLFYLALVSGSGFWFVRHPVREDT